MPPDDTTEEKRRDNTNTQSSTEDHEDPSGRLLSMYLTVAKEEDDQMAKNWTDDTGGVLVFTGLFSSIVATFISISLPGLSPDPNAPTVALLAQLVNISSGLPVVAQNTPFKAPASIVRVNVMWILSLILSLSCALLATLMQQWTRRYLDYAQRRGAPIMRLLIRAYILDEVEKFVMSHAVEMMPLILHISVFLFFAGLIDFIFPIDKVVAFFALGCVTVFAFVYAILTLLPNLRLNSPYRTPLSGFTFFVLQFSALSLFTLVKAIEGTFHGWMLKIWRWTHQAESLYAGPEKWKYMLEEKVKTHYHRFLHGLRWSVERGAIKALPRIFPGVLNWALTASDDKKPEDFITLVPEFFNHLASIKATSAMLSLMSEQPTSDPFLGSYLYDLLITCLPSFSTLDEKQRKKRLRVCLKCLWSCVRAYLLPENSGEPLSPYVRSNFASPDVIGWIRTEADSTSRLLGRCFGSLVVKKLVDDLTSLTHTGTAGDSITPEMACISNIHGDPVSDWFLRAGSVDLANIVFLLSGELETLVDSGTKGYVEDIFQQTLSILAEGFVRDYDIVVRDREQEARFHERHSRFANARISDALKKTLQDISDRLHQLPPMRAEISSLEPHSGTTPPGMSQTSRGGPDAPESSSVVGISSTPAPVDEIV